MFVEKCLVLLVPSTEILQEFMSQFHDLLHSDIFTLVLITVLLFLNIQYINWEQQMCKNYYVS